MANNTEYKFSFEKLEVWQNAIALVSDVYLLLKKFPPEEKYALCLQIQRSAISVPSNIAEGSARFSLPEQARFTEIAYGSLLELLNQFIIAKDLDYISENDLFSIREKVSLISRQLNALQQRQKGKNYE